MRSRSLVLAAASGAALLAAALPATAGTPRPGAPAHGPLGTREGTVSAAELLAELETCTQISTGKYRMDASGAATVPVCGLKGAVFWKADMDIDCDGRVTAECNTGTDPWFLPDTAFHQSNGEPLDSAALPHIVVPGPSTLWKYADSGIRGGSVAAVVYNGKVRYGVVGDTGPAKIIGEASYAMAKALGIDPDPATGGVASGVSYIVFKDSRVSPIEDHAAAVTLGDSLARQFLKDN
jgi:hypothetical protein